MAPLRSLLLLAVLLCGAAACQAREGERQARAVGRTRRRAPAVTAALPRPLSLHLPAMPPPPAAPLSRKLQQATAGAGAQAAASGQVGAGVPCAARFPAARLHVSLTGQPSASRCLPPTPSSPCAAGLPCRALAAWPSLCLTGPHPCLPRIPDGPTTLPQGKARCCRHPCGPPHTLPLNPLSPPISPPRPPPPILSDLQSLTPDFICSNPSAAAEAIAEATAVAEGEGPLLPGGSCRRRRRRCSREWW